MLGCPRVPRLSLDCQTCIRSRSLHRCRSSERTVSVPNALLACFLSDTRMPGRLCKAEESSVERRCEWSLSLSQRLCSPSVRGPSYEVRARLHRAGIYLFILTAVSLLPRRTWSFVRKICARADGPTSSTVYVLLHTLYANTLCSRRFISMEGCGLRRL